MLKSSFRIARIKDIDIRVHITFALVLIFAALDWGLWRGLGWTGALYGLAFTSILFVFVTLHELGHSLVARYFGGKVRDITLLPIGGVARLEGELTKPMHEFWMALAGPMVNVALAIVLGAVTLPLLSWRALSGLGELRALLTGLSIEGMLVELIVANVGLAVFNLLPAFPMDGGRVLRSFLATQIDELRATKIAVRVGQGIAILLGLVGLFGGGLTLPLIAIFIFMGAQQEWRGAQMKAAVRHVNAEAAVMHGGILLAPDDAIGQAVNVLLRTGQQDFAVFENGYLVGILTRDDLRQGFERYGPYVPVRRVMQTDFPVAQAQDSLLSLQNKMQATGSTVISVLQGNSFLGLATREGIKRAMSSAWRVQPRRA